MNQTKTGLRIGALKLSGLQRVVQEMKYLQIDLFDLFTATELESLSQVQQEASINNERIERQAEENFEFLLALPSANIEFHNIKRLKFR